MAESKVKLPRVTNGGNFDLSCCLTLFALVVGWDMMGDEL